MGRVSPNEEKQYAQGVKVYFTPKSVNNKQTMDKYNQWFISQVRLVLSVVGNCLQYLFRFKTEILNCSSWTRWKRISILRVFVFCVRKVLSLPSYQLAVRCICKYLILQYSLSLRNITTMPLKNILISMHQGARLNSLHHSPEYYVHVSLLPHGDERSLRSTSKKNSNE